MADKMINLLPERFSKSDEIVNFENAIESVVNMAEDKRDELMMQFNVDTATWGLDFWEKQYGLKTDILKDYDERRSRIKSKMRGCGTTTAKLIKNISESFVNGEVDIIEHNEEYYFEVVMASIIGLPPNMEDLKLAVEEVKPAHINVVYVIRYNTHNGLKNLKHNELSAFSHKEIREIPN